MARTRETEALVVGAGPVGLFAALSLARRGIETRIIDADFRTVALSYALALHPRSIDVLDEAGVAEGLIEKGRKVARLAFYEGEERRAEVSLAATPARHPWLLVAPQSAIEAAFERALRDRGVTVEWSRELSRLEPVGETLRASVDVLEKASAGYAVATTEWSVERQEALAARLVVGADGLRSSVRRNLGIAFPESSPAEHYAVFEFDAELDDPEEVRVVFAPAGRCVLWPLPGRRCRFSFELPPGSEALAERVKSRVGVQIGKGLYPHLTREDLFGFIGDRAPWFRAEVGDVRWSLLVRFPKRLADSFGRGATWLMGDAAHTLGPVGILSMNLGFREAADFSERAEAVLRGRGPVSGLAEYGQRWASECRARMGIEGPPPAGAVADGWLRDNLDRILPCVPATGGDLAAVLAAGRA